MRCFGVNGEGGPLIALRRRTAAPPSSGRSSVGWIRRCGRGERRPAAPAADGANHGQARLHHPGREGCTGTNDPYPPRVAPPPARRALIRFGALFGSGSGEVCLEGTDHDLVCAEAGAHKLWVHHQQLARNLPRPGMSGQRCWRPGGGGKTPPQLLLGWQADRGRSSHGADPPDGARRGWGGAGDAPAG